MALARKRNPQFGHLEGDCCHTANGASTCQRVSVARSRLETGWSQARLPFGAAGLHLAAARGAANRIEGDPLVKEIFLIKIFKI